MSNKQIKPAKKEGPLEFAKTLLIALICAGIVRSFFFEPFHIPSSSMKPGLLIGDYIFVSKYSYGYSRYSFPLGLDLFEGRIWKSEPKRGDVSVFRLPSNPRINYIKRIIGLPGDKIQMRDGVLFINDDEIIKNPDGVFVDSDNEIPTEIDLFTEKMLDGKNVLTLDKGEYPQDNTETFEVPEGNYFMMGDNRDNSKDSRFPHVGFVPEENLVGRTTSIFFSNSKPTWQIWNWPNSIRFKRIFKKVD